VDGERLLCVQQSLQNTRVAHYSQDDILLKYLPDNGSARSLLNRGVPIHIGRWKVSIASSELSFFECLLYHLYKGSTDPRDMIYGLAALANEKSRYQVKIDYSLDVARIYTDFARSEISTSRRLNILTCVCSSSRSYDLPSWVPDLALGPTGHFFFRNAELPRFNFSAAVETDAITTFDAQQNVLAFKGLVVGCLDVVGPPTDMTSWNDLKALPEAFIRWWYLVTKMEGNQVLNHKAFARTLVLDRVRPEFKSSDQMSKYLRAILGGYGDLFREKYPGMSADALVVLMGYWNDYIAGKRIEEQDEFFSEQRMRELLRTWKKMLAPTGTVCSSFTGVLRWGSLQKRLKKETLSASP
jgi:hypothetical protein